LIGRVLAHFTRDDCTFTHARVAVAGESSEQSPMLKDRQRISRE
jgi:hypothetical protein